MANPIDTRVPGLEFYLLFWVVMLGCGAWFVVLLRRRNVWMRAWPPLARMLALNLAAAWVFLSAGFVVLETYYRFVYDTTDSFNYTFVSNQWFARYYRYNAAHMRDNVEYLEAIPPGKRRITFIGDSFTVGHGVKDVDARFVNRLRHQHPDWDVQMLATDGMDTAGEIEAAQRLLQNQYPMDLVVLVYCLNDIADMMPEWNAALLRLYEDEDQRNWLVKHSFFADAYYYRLKARLKAGIPDYYSVVRAAYSGPLWGAQTQRLSILKALVEQNGGRLVVVTFPFLHALGDHYEYQGAHDQLDRWWQEQKVPHLDLLPVFRQQSPAAMVVNRLDAHPNPRAHTLAAAAMDEFLSAQLRGPTKAPR
jgi:hypothetical protein